MVTLIRIALHLIEDALRWVVLLFRSAEIGTIFTIRLPRNGQPETAGGAVDAH